MLIVVFVLLACLPLLLTLTLNSPALMSFLVIQRTGFPGVVAEAPLPHRYDGQLFAGLVMALFVVAIGVFRKTKSFVLTAAWFYFAVSCLRTAAWPWGQILVPYDLYAKALQSGGWEALSLFLAVTLPLLLLDDDVIEAARRAVIGCGVLSLVVVVGLWATGIRARGDIAGIFWNGSIEATFGVLALGLIYRWRVLWPFLILAAVACYASTSVAAAAALAVITVGRLPIDAPPKAMFALSGLCFAFASDPSSNGRWEMWERTMRFYESQDSLIQAIGVGGGTFSRISPGLQITEAGKVVSNLFTLAHNDYLQCLFDHGYIGLCLAGLVLLVATLRSWLILPWLTAGVVAAAVASIAQFPAHLPLSALCLMLYVRLAMTGSACDRSGP